MSNGDKPRAAIHVGAPAKSFSAAEGNEPERRGWDEKTYRLKNQDTNNHYDFTRKRLNFEVNSKGQSTQADGDKTIITSLMNFLNLLKVALRAIASNKFRSFLSMLGIIIGVAAIATLSDPLHEGIRSRRFSVVSAPR